MSTPSLAILDGETRATLGIVRSLGAKGIPVIVGSNTPFGRSGFSKYSVSRFNYPPIGDNPDYAHAVILNKIKSLRPEILMPVSDASWELVYKHYDEYSKFIKIIPNPGYQLFNNLRDKALLTDYAEKSDIHIPQTYRPATTEAALALSEELPYPVMLKPRSSAGGIGIKKASSPKEFMNLIQKEQEVPVIQQYIHGEDLELTLFSINGDPIAGSAYLSLRNAPLPYGPPIACITIKDDQLMETGIKLLRSLQYTGAAHLDFRRDRKDGGAKLLDFNARLAGTNELSTFSGIDFAYFQYLSAIGGKLDRVFEYKLGLEFRWVLPGEIRHFLQTQYKSRTLKALLKWRDVKTEISFKDPKPHFFMFFDAFTRLYSKLS